LDAKNNHTLFMVGLMANRHDPPAGDDVRLHSREDGSGDVSRVSDEENRDQDVTVSLACLGLVRGALPWQICFRRF